MTMANIFASVHSDGAALNQQTPVTENAVVIQAPASGGRLHSLTKGCFREAKLHRQLYGDEL